MQLPDEAIDRFVTIYERKFNEPISRADAIAMARQLVNLYRQFLRPLPPEVMDQLGREHRAGEGPIDSALDSGVEPNQE